MPFFNSETGAINPDSPDLYTDGQPPAAEAKPPAPPPAKDAAPGPLTEPEAGSPAAAAREFTTLRQEIIDNLYHPFRDERHPLHEAAVKDFLRLQMLAD